MRKRVLAAVLTLAMMFSLSVSASAANTTIRTEDVKISVDGKAIDVPKGSIWISEDGYTMVGARALAEGFGAEIKWDSATRTAVITGMEKQVGVYTPVAANEYLLGAAVWQMSAECHGLMMQAFNIGKRNVDEMVAKAKAGTDGFTLENGKLFKDGKRVAVFSDIDDTLVDGVHYTANIVGKGGDWNNAAFARFVMSEGCTALPGAVEFVKYCVDNGIEFFYVTNRYDQGYKVGQKDSKGGYDGTDGYKKADGTVIGTSTYDVFGKTFYDISYDSMTKLGFPLNADAHLITNDNKLNGSNKQPIRDAVANGAKAYPTGERTNESTKHPGTFDIDEHYIAMFCGDDLNDISTIFSGDAVDRVQKAIDNMDKWGTEWIILPNAIYGSSINAGSAYGYLKLLETFDYTNSATTAWNLYK